MKTGLKLLFAVAALGLGAQAKAVDIITISPGGNGSDEYQCDETSNLESLTEINDNCGTPGPDGTSPGFTTAADKYKYNTEGGSEDGGLAGSYQVENIVNDDGEPAGFDIVYSGSGQVIDCSVECFIVVKDGENGAPSQYVFDLSTVANIEVWDGVDTLRLSGFWVGTQGAISNAALWGGMKDPPDLDVPAPATLALLGLGLVGLGVRRRRMTP